MSLQVWLPLTKDLRQQGLSTTTYTQNSGTTISSGGKLGFCLTATSNATVVVNLSSLATMLANGKTYSLACWVKITNNVTSSWVIKLGTNSCGLWWAASEARWVWNENDNGKRCANPTISADTNWHHLCIVVDKTVTNKITTKQYVDGVLAANYPGSTWDCSSHSQPAGTTITIYPYAAQLNDIRLYDHCLSLMEVKELAKGLVLHYPLNRQGWGQENLILHTHFNESDWWTNNTSSAVVSNNKVTIQAAGEFYQKYGSLPTTSIPANTQLTLSCYFYENTISTGNHRIYYASSPSWKYVSVPANFTGLFVNTFTTSEELTKVTIDYDTRNMTAGKWVCGPCKLEIGNKATPWCPNSSDTLATTMGLNSTTEYDCSGFCNNGTKVGTLGWSSNTSKYNVSLDVTTDSCARYIYGPAQTQLTDQITLACWLYQTSATATSGGNSTTNQFALSQGRDYLNLGFNITVNNGKPGVYAGNGGSESGARVSLISTTKTITGSWHHVAATYNNGALKLYVDGQLDRETTIGALDYVDAPALVIGKMAYGYTNATSYFPFVGYISDARVYATALSADDVKSLYQNSAYIDSSGNVYGAVHTEV